MGEVYRAENRSWIFGQAGPRIAGFLESDRDLPHSQESMWLDVTEISELINSQAMNR